MSDKHYFTLERGESIRIGPDVMLRFVDVRKWTKALLGVEAPKEVSVHRAEVADRIAAEKGGAA